MLFGNQGEPRRDALHRATWGTLSSITRKIPNPKANNRKNAETDGVPILHVFLHKNAPVNDRGILYLAVVTAYFMKVPSIICCR